MIKTIYGNSHCSRCCGLKEKYPDADYYEVDKMTYEEKVELRELIKSQVTSATVNYPICLDENGRLVNG